MTLNRIAFLCFQDASASTLAGPCEVFKYAAAHAIGEGSDCALDISVVTPDGAAVTSEGFIKVQPSEEIETAENQDLIFVTGMSYGRDVKVESSRRICRWLAEQYAQGACLAAVCAGQALFASAGLLDNRPAAIHWSLLDKFQERWPSVRWSADRMVVADRGIYTSCGATSGIDLTLCLIERFYGVETMAACARWFLVDFPRLRRNLPPQLFSPPRSADETMRDIEAWLFAHFQEPVRFEALAAEYGMSWRTFQRRFAAAFRDSPKTYLQKLRLAAAQNLLEEGSLSVDQIAVRVGYDYPAYFRTLFKRHISITPSEYRKAYKFSPVSASDPGEAGRAIG